MDIIDINEENPLQYNFPNTQQSKNSGRPRRSEKIIFSPAPRSIVSLLLRNSLYDEAINNNSRDNLVSKTNKDTTDKKNREWVCRQCSFRTNNKHSLKEHKTTHKNKVHQCDFTDCKYFTKSSSNLIKHKRTHTAEKPYICDKCLFRTNFQNSLTVHKRIHTSEKPYACQYCDYRCNSSSNLKKHCRYRHVKEG